MKIYAYHGKKNVCGEQIRVLRKEKGFTQTTLAARLQSCNVWLDQKAISRIELEERVVADYELWAIAQVLQVDIAELLKTMPALEEDNNEMNKEMIPLRRKTKRTLSAPKETAEADSDEITKKNEL